MRRLILAVLVGIAIGAAGTEVSREVPVSAEPSQPTGRAIPPGAWPIEIETREPDGSYLRLRINGVRWHGVAVPGEAR